MKILTIIGARPQFVKAAMVSRAIAEYNQKAGTCLIEEYIVHTGQHFDENMSDVFFAEMNIPQPVVRLNCGGGSHAEMTGKMLIAIEPIIGQYKPDFVLVYGDTNSTLAGALCAAKLHIPIAHVEAGLRSFNFNMPEEINRILTDRLSTLLFCPTQQAVSNLKNEGITQGVHAVGDVMYDAAIRFGNIAEKESHIIKDLQLTPKSYYLATVHRAENTDNVYCLTELFDAFSSIATEKCPVILPVHPRTLKQITQFSISYSRFVKLIEPVSFLDMIMLEKSALCILTDSGGIQKEAYFHKVPCITLRNETEWTETVDAGWNQLAACNKEKILTALQNHPPKQDIVEYGTGNAATEIVELLCR